MIRIGLVGCGRILNAHLQRFMWLRERGIDTFRICGVREPESRMIQGPFMGASAAFSPLAYLLC